MLCQHRCAQGIDFSNTFINHFSTPVLRGTLLLLFPRLRGGRGEKQQSLLRLSGTERLPPIDRRCSPVVMPCEVADWTSLPETVSLLVCVLLSCCAENQLGPQRLFALLRSPFSPTLLSCSPSTTIMLSQHYYHALPALLSCSPSTTIMSADYIDQLFLVFWVFFDISSCVRQIAKKKLNN